VCGLMVDLFFPEPSHEGRGGPPISMASGHLASHLAYVVWAGRPERDELELAVPHDPSFPRAKHASRADATPVHAARQPLRPGAGARLPRARQGPLTRQLTSRSLIQLSCAPPSCWRLRRPRGRQAKVFQDLLHHGRCLRSGPSASSVEGWAQKGQNGAGQSDHMSCHYVGVRRSLLGPVGF
jgi:hypothetical protein